MKKNSMVQKSTFRSLFTRFAVIALLPALLAAVPFHAAWAATAPSLNTAQSFAVLGGSTVINTGPTIITGDLGVNPGTAVTGFPPGLVTGGTIHAADAVALQAQNDTTTAYNNLAGQACNFDLTGQDLGGMTLVPGVYCFTSSAELTGTLTLNAGGDPNAVWVFKTVSTLTTASNSSVLLTNGGQPCNVFWQIGSSATLGSSTSFIGNILALTSITLTTDARISGRALARNGAVTMDSNTVAISVCGVPPVTPIPPTLGKAFSPATIAAGGVSTLTITLSNADTTAASLTAPFIDTLPSGVTIAGTPNAGTTCGGTVTANSGASALTLTGGVIPANSSCAVTVDVTAPNGGSYINSVAAGDLQTSNGNNAAPAVATLTVTTPLLVAPTLGKTFSPATIAAGGVSTLTITLSNADVTSANLTAPFIDTLPSGVVIAPTPSASTTCGGVLTVGTSTVTLTGGSIPANGSCTVSVDVTAPIGGSYFNSLAAGTLQTSNGNNAAPAVATLTVSTPAGGAPTLGKAFSPATIAVGGISTLTITLSNTSDTAADLTAPLIDTLPSGVMIASTPSTDCGGTLTAGTSTVTLTGGSIPANSFCTVTVDVTAPNGGSYFNSLAAGALQTSNGNNAAPAVATLTVSPPSAVALGKTFSPATITAGGISTITITLSNTSNSAANLTAPLIDTLPSGLVVAGSGPNASTTCGGTLNANTGDTTVTLTGGSIPANGSCTVKFDVYAPVGGSYFNSLAVGALQTSNGNNAAPAVATLTVKLPANIAPKLCKSFSPAIINAGKVSTLTITLYNPNSTIANLTAPLIDSLPSGLVIAGSGPNASTTCGGVLTANEGASMVTLTGGAIPAKGSCIVKVDVTAKDKGSYCNKLPVGALRTDKGSNVTSAVATLSVYLEPKLCKSFSPAIINAGKVSSLTITLSNPNSSSVAKLTAPLTDYLPSGLVVAKSRKSSNNCGGKLTANAGDLKVTLTGGSIPANGSCTVTVPVTAKYKGSYCNKLPVGALQTDKGSNVISANATLSVYLEPKLCKSFYPAIINAGKVSTLTITLSNPNSSSAASLTAPLTDALPSGLMVAGSGNFSNTCGGTLMAKAGDRKVTLAGGSIPTNSSCTVTVPVIAKHNGRYCNKLPVGALQTNIGKNATPAIATLTVVKIHKKKSNH